MRVPAFFPMALVLSTCISMCQTRECSRYTKTSDSYVLCSSSLGISWYCSGDYSCCGTGCCLKDDQKQSPNAYSEYEIAGLVLSTTALGFMALLALIILGATFCNSNKDHSSLFGKGGRS